MRLKSVAYRLHNEVAFGIGYAGPDRTLWWTFLIWAGYFTTKGEKV